MTHYALYNEIDPFCAQTIRNLIAAGHIMPGHVDERSVTELTPYDLRGFTQFHTFAGVGVWSLALRRAGWPDERPCWSGSAPCQPWSAAGAGKGADDERHLWPHWFENLIKECRPDVIFGEQVADASVLGKAVRLAGGGPDGAPRAWFDIISDDLEAAHYAVGAVPFTSCLTGAPHIRDRLYWVAESDDPQWRPDGAGGHDSDGADARWPQGAGDAQGCSGVVGMGNSDDPRLEVGVVGPGRIDVPQGRQDAERSGGLSGGAQRMADTGGAGPHAGAYPGVHSGEGGAGPRDGEPERSGATGRPSTPHQPWDAPDWIWCRDGKWRPVESGSQPLAYGLARGMGTLDAGLAGLADVAGLDDASLKRAKAYRVGALRAYGNAINVVAAQRFIEAWLAVRG